MDFHLALESRRSIRRFRPDPLARDVIMEILRAGTLAPSAKNSQPWRFVVVEQEKREMLDAMRAGLERQAAMQNGDDLSRMILKGAQYTLTIMEQAPITVFVLNERGKPMGEGLSPYMERFGESSIVQSVGAAVENICLAAAACGIGSLWICDVFSAYDELCAWLGTDMQLAAAIALGYADEAPGPRPRRPVEEVTQWR